MIPSNQEVGVQNTFNIRNLIVNPKSLDEKLNCSICKKFAIDPKECVECQYLFCLDCIQKWANTQKQCPQKCSAQEMKYKDPHRFVTHAYNQIQLRCPFTDCERIFQIAQLNMHIQNCENQEEKCLNNGCNLMIKKKELNTHVKLNCSQRMIQCDKCKDIYQFSNKHDCISFLLSKIESQQKMIEQMQEMLLKTYQQISKLIEATFGNQNNVQLCNKGHNLTWTAPKYQVICKKCNQQKFIIRYECLQCNYQVCQGWVKPQFKSLRCPLLHPFIFQQKAKDNLVCDFCDCFPFANNVGVYHDAQCDFDVCNDCYNKYKT